MSEPKRFEVADAILVILVLVVALGARAGYLLTCADGGNNEGPLRVQDRSPRMIGLPSETQFRGKSNPTEFDALVHNLKDNQWFGSLAPFAAREEPTAHVSPGYPWLVGLAARFLGDNTDKIVRWSQCVLGALTAVVYFLFARRAFHSTFVAAITGFACALYPLWIINTATLDDGVLTTFLLAVSLLLGTRAAQTAGAFTSLLYGLALAGLSLVRAAMLPFAFVALAWFLLRSRTLARGWLCALLAFLGFANGLVPWTVRNVQVFHEPMPIVDSVYWHLWIGNNPKATGGPLTDEMLKHAPATRLLAIDKQPRRYAELGHVVLDELKHDPLAAVQRRVRATLGFWFGELLLNGQKPAEEDPSVPAPDWLKSAWPLTVLGSLLGVLLLALFGWRWTYPWQRDAMPSVLALIWVPLPYLLAHAEALHGPRLPLDGVLLCYAAFALASLFPQVGSALWAGPKAADPSAE